MRNVGALEAILVAKIEPALSINHLLVSRGELISAIYFYVFFFESKAVGVE